jgi:Ca2+-binding RTX toxin-like protein
MATSASFSPTSGLLTELGDSLDNSIVTSRDAAGHILVNGGAVPVVGGSATVANTSTIQTFGQGGNDTITLDESKGALPAANLFGGTGNDTITGGSGNDMLFGEDGNDTLLGKAGNDQLFGGAGNDALTGGTGNDQVFGQAGNDRMIWNSGDGSDLFEGGDGIDTAEIDGGNGAETFTITANGTRVRFDGVTPAPFSLDIGTTESLVLHAGGGNDVITAGNGLASLISLTLDGGDGNDMITGGDGADTLLGGTGNDVVSGGRGNDLAQLGDGNDTFVWNPGDGSDTVDGGAGTDTLLFNGANVNEKINIAKNGSGVTLTRDVANITMNLTNMEKLEVVARGGADTITIGDLTGTSVKEVDVDLSGTGSGSPLGDGAADNVIASGTAGNDRINITGAGTAVSVMGLPATIKINGAEGANDRLTVNGLGGNDTINASTLAAGIIGLTIDGGAGDDTITGSQGADTLIGGDGNDNVIGGRGDDVAFLGTGNDRFTWNPGDGSDVVEGQDGVDILQFNGSNVNENIDVSANGGRVRLTRDVGAVTMDLNSIEQIKIATLGGADNVTVNDLTGTGVNTVFVQLGAGPSSATGDGQVDNVNVNATAANDTIRVATAGAAVVVTGLAATTNVNGIDAGLDALTVNGLGGDDVINASGLHAGQVKLTINGGDGNDTITGSAGDDLVIGGRGNDVSLLGAGNDTYVWNPGDGSDTVDGQAGTDTLVFNGANVNENIVLSANGSRARLTRDVGNITMDLNSVETIDVNALGGADTLTVNDLTGTGVKNVNIDLSSPPGSGAGDGQADTIVINATNAADKISVSTSGGVITVSGLAETVTITGAEAANDRLIINGLGGDDTIDASKLSGILLTANGGDGNDVLVGSPGNDTLLGGAGDDVLIGGPGADILDGGTGNNILIQDGGSALSATADAVSLFMKSAFATTGDTHNGLSPADFHASLASLLTHPRA